MRRRRGQYAHYLDSRDWKLQRAYRIALAGGRCERCGSRRPRLPAWLTPAGADVGAGLQAHHLTYARVGHEHLDDLEVLCRGCHQHEHNIQTQEQPLPANNAKLTGAPAATGALTVTLTAITVNGTGMTLAIFNQLPKRQLTRDGTPWGTVNVCPSRHCPTYDNGHRHVLWEAGGQLYRDTCQPPDGWAPSSKWTKTWAVLAAADTDRRHITWNKDDGYAPYCYITFVEGLPAVACTLPNERELWEAVRQTRGKATAPPCACGDPDRNDGVHNDCGVRWREAQAVLEQRAAKQKHSIDEVEAFVQRDIREQHEWFLAACAQWEEVKALPQLFLGGMPTP